MTDVTPDQRAAVTVDELAHALDNATPYPIELDGALCRFMAERLLDMLTVGKRPEHPVWQPEEQPEPGEQPQPMDPTELRRLAGEAQQSGEPQWICKCPAELCRCGHHSEAQQDPTQDGPQRGDQFEQWLKTQRDENRDTGRGIWTTLDNLLDQYRLHADTGTPLGEHVCEGQAVGDCEHLEPPTAVARSGQPETDTTPPV